MLHTSETTRHLWEASFSCPATPPALIHVKTNGSNCGQASTGVSLNWSTAMRMLLVAVTVATSAFGQTGPVAALCTQDIQTCCANKGHGSRQTRTCLEANRDKLSAECQ
jgi:hypothetical protein